MYNNNFDSSNIFLASNSANSYFSKLISSSPLNLLAQFHEFLDTVKNYKQLDDIASPFLNERQFDLINKKFANNIPVVDIIASCIKKFKEEESETLEFNAVSIDNAKKYLKDEIEKVIKQWLLDNLNKKSLKNLISEIIFDCVSKPLFLNKSSDILEHILTTILNVVDSEGICLKEIIDNVETLITTRNFSAKEHEAINNHDRKKILRAQWDQSYREWIELKVEEQKLRESIQYVLITKRNDSSDDETKHFTNLTGYENLNDFKEKEKDIIICKNLNSNEVIQADYRNSPEPKRLKLSKGNKPVNIYNEKNYICLFTEKDTAFSIYKIYPFSEEDEAINNLEFNKLKLGTVQSLIHNKQVLPSKENDKNPLSKIDKELENLENFKKLLASSIDALDVEINQYQEIAEDHLYLSFNPELAKQKADVLKNLKSIYETFKNKNSATKEQLNQDLIKKIAAWRTEAVTAALTKHRTPGWLRSLGSMFIKNDKSKSEEFVKALIAVPNT